MDVLEGFNLYSEEDCLVEVLDYWLKNHPSKPTWQEITDAQRKLEMFNSPGMLINTDMLHRGYSIMILLKQVQLRRKKLLKLRFHHLNLQDVPAV